MGTNERTNTYIHTYIHTYIQEYHYVLLRSWKMVVTLLTGHEFEPERP